MPNVKKTKEKKNYEPQGCVFKKEKKKKKEKSYNNIIMGRNFFIFKGGKREWQVCSLELASRG